MDDPLEQLARKVSISSGLVSSTSGNTVRVEVDPLGTTRTGSLEGKESQLEVMTTSLDVADSQFRLNELKLLRISSTPNALELNAPWAWGLGISMNRYNFTGELAKEVELNTGKTFILNRLRAELSVGLGVQSLEGSHAFTTSKVSTYYQVNNAVGAGMAVEDKKMPADIYRITSAFISIDRWMLRRRMLGHRSYENSFSFSWAL